MTRLPVLAAATGAPARRGRTLVLALAALALAGCQTAYYAALEKVGIPKRDLMQTRVEAARDAQMDARTQVVDALEQFGKTVNYSGGDLEAQYKSLAGKLGDGEQAARTVRKRIEDVESVSAALFAEWETELGQYANAELRARSSRQLADTRRRYDGMMAAMRRAESRLEPALRPLRDQVLFMKHNLNARALSGLKGELVRVDAEVDRLVAEINAAVVEADRFIAALGS